MSRHETSARERAIREDRAKVFDGMKAIMARADGGAELSVEDKTAFDQAELRLQELDKDLARIVTMRKRDEARDDLDNETRGALGENDTPEEAEKRYAEVFNRYLRRGDKGMRGAERQLLEEHRALSTSQSDSDKAGFLIPQGFWHNLQIAMKAYGGTLELCRQIRTSTGNPMPWPTTDPTSIIGSYLTENTQVGNQDYPFGQGELFAWTIVSGVVFVSIQLAKDSAFDVEEFVTDRIGEAIGRKVAQELITGTGSSAFLGVQTALAARGVLAGAQGGLYQVPATSKVYTITGGAAQVAKLANGLVGFDDILAMIAKVDPAYRKGGKCAWVMDDLTLQNLRAVTDAYGHPLWNPDVRVGGEDRLYGYPYVIDQNIGNISTSASTVGGLMFGDLSRAMVVRTVDQADVLALHERYADFLQVGYLGYVRMDARSNDLRAAVMLETGSS